MLHLNVKSIDVLDVLQISMLYTVVHYTIETPKYILCWISSRKVSLSFFCSAAKNAVKGKVATSFLAVGHVSHMYGFYGKVITDRFWQEVCVSAIIRTSVFAPPRSSLGAFTSFFSISRWFFFLFFKKLFNSEVSPFNCLASSSVWFGADVFDRYLATRGVNQKWKVWEGKCYFGLAGRTERITYETYDLVAQRAYIGYANIGRFFAVTNINWSTGTKLSLTMQNSGENCKRNMSIMTQLRHHIPMAHC